MRLTWVTDPHFNHVALPAWRRWVDDVTSSQPDALLITGDISESHDIVFQLERIADAVDCPTHFVLGNHDFYRGSIAGTRAKVVDVSRQRPAICYLSDSDPIEIASDVFLVGDDGWGDALVGDYENSSIRLNDFRLIDDFVQSDPDDWKELLIQQGHESAKRVQQKLAGLPENAKHVLLLTHVPPFRESCWYMGQTTDDNWAPFFVCGSMGEVLLEADKLRPERKITVLCGHTHHDGVAEMTENLVVHTGAAEYGSPGIEAIVNVDTGGISIAKPN